MADFILQQGGSGGISSDDVTASRAQVLRGCYTVTTDSNDEVIEGTIQAIDTSLNDFSLNKSNVYGIDFGRRAFYIDFPHGNAYYYRGDNRPHTCIDSGNLGNATAGHVLSDVTFTSEHGVKIQGALTNRGGESAALNMWWENGNLMTAFNEGAYWRHHDDTNNNWRWSPRVRVSGTYLGNANASYVHEGITFTSQHGLRLVGTMREWKPTARDIANAWNNEAVVFDSYDSSYSGRKLLLKVPAWWRIGAINWVGIEASQYLPQNVRAGVHLPGGLVGTMPHPEPIQNDLNNTRNQLNNTTNELNNVRNQLNNTINELNGYKNSKVAFNGATFDGQLLSGVAEKGFVAKGEIFFYRAMNDYGYKGIYDGGFNLNIGTTFLSNQYYDERDYGIGITLNTSVNLTTYRQVVVSYRHIYSVVSPYALSYNRAEIAIHGYIGRASSKKADYTVGIQRGAGKPQGAYLVGECADVLASKIEVWQSSRMSSHSSPEHLDTSGQLIIDVGSINEHCFLSLGAILNKTGSDASTYGRTIITKIEFLN
jgi:hypothetical protein|nr:MAG TPA: hypothetical protein [Caudoviricetes sp.]